MRVKSAGPQRRQRRKRILKNAEGLRGRRKNTIRRGQEAVDKSRENATIDRKQRKRRFRQLWIARINAAARQNGTTYSRLIAGLNKAGIKVDRKIMAEIAYSDAEGFAAIVAAASLEQ